MAPTTTTTTKAAPPKAKATNGGVKKGRGPGAKKANARQAMQKMQDFFKKHRHEFKDLPFKDQQKELGKKWKAAPENPKATA